MWKYNGPVVTPEFAAIGVGIAALVVTALLLSHIGLHPAIAQRVRTFSLVLLAACIIVAALGWIKAGREGAEVAFWFVCIALCSAFAYAQGVLTK